MSSILKIPNFMDKTMSKNGWSNIPICIPSKLLICIPTNLPRYSPIKLPSNIGAYLGILDPIFNPFKKLVYYNLNTYINKIVN